MSKNFATSLLTNAPGTGGTSVTVTTGTGSRFISGLATVGPDATTWTPANAEVVTITAISTDTLTVTRSSESSTAMNLAAGYRIVQGVTAGMWDALVGAIGAPSVTTVSSAGSSRTLVASSAGETSVYDVTLSASTCTVSLTGAQSGKRTVVEVWLRQDATGGRLVSWPSSIRWSTGLAPVLTALPNRADVIQLVSLDGGTSWFGGMVGMAFGAQAVPSAPSSPAAVAGNGKITIAWNGVAGALPYVTSYKLYRGTSSGSETLLGDVGNVTTYDDTTMTPGQTTYYKVSAVNGVGESALSSEVAAASLTVGSLPSTSTAATMWYTGIAITGISDGGSVGSWADSSSTNAPAVNAIGGSQPSYIASATANSKPAVRWVSGNYLISPTGLASNSKFTLFAVAKVTGGSTAKGIFGSIGPGGSGAGTGGLELRIDSSGKLEALSANTASIVTSSAAVTNLGTQFHVFSARAATYSGSARAVDVEVDGVRTTASSSVQITLTNGRQVLGYGFHNGSSQVDTMAGDIAEVIYYPAELSDADYALVKNYLANKYSITVS